MLLVELVLSVLLTKTKPKNKNHKRTRKFLKVMDIRSTLIMVMVPQLCIQVRTHQKVYFKHMQFKNYRSFIHNKGEGNGTPLQYSCLENPMDGGAQQAAVHGVAKSQTRLSYFTFTFHFSALEKEIATHSSVLAWRIPGTGEPGGLPSMGSHRVGHD